MPNLTGGAHALLAPSSSERWLTCTPSALKATQFKNTSNEAAEEGTLAHQLAEYMLMQYEGRLSLRAYTELFDGIKQHRLYSDQMHKHIQGYVAYAVRLIEETKRKDPKTIYYVERRFDLDVMFPESGGTPDLVIIGNRTLIVLDLKFGIVEYIEAKGNSQLRLYALAAYHGLSAEFVFLKSFQMHVYQPRRDNVSFEELGLGEILRWGDQIKEAANLAARGKGNFVAGAHCLYCPFKIKCKACYIFNFKLLDLMIKDQIDELDDEDYATIILHGKALVKWYEGIKTHLTERMQQGRPVHGLKLVKGRSYRSITNHVKLAKTLGLTMKDISKVDVLPLTKIEDKVGKKEFEKADKYITIVEGKPEITSAEDPRSDFMTCSDFDDVTNLDFDF